MGPDKIEAILKLLAQYPDGLTAKEAAPHLGWTWQATGQRMFELTWDNTLTRALKDPMRRAGNAFVYKITPPKVQAPEAATQWPELRLPQRAIHEPV